MPQKDCLKLSKGKSTVESQERLAPGHEWSPTGVLAQVIGFLGVYSNPEHIVEYTDGERRQQFEVVYIGRPVGGEPRINDEADDVRWIAPDDLASFDIHPSMHEQIGHYLRGTYPYLA